MSLPPVIVRKKKASKLPGVIPNLPETPDFNERLKPINETWAGAEASLMRGPCVIECETDRLDWKRTPSGGLRIHIDGGLALSAPLASRIGALHELPELMRLAAKAMEEHLKDVGL